MQVSGFTPRSLYSLCKNAGIQGWVCRSAGLDFVAKRKTMPCRESNSGRLVNITELLTDCKSSGLSKEESERLNTVYNKAHHSIRSTECRGQVFNTHASYSGGIRFKFWSGDQLPRMRFFVTFISPSR
jgi:hypothetical protein